MTNKNLPTFKDLVSNVEIYEKQDESNYLLSQPPPKEWVKEHPFVKNYKYLPIDKVEHLLRGIFKSYKIEVTGQGTAFNGVWCTVRVHYKDIATGEWMFHDGIGACELQTKKGTSPADLSNINNGALSMAFPIAKTVAVKDACDHFGNLFGANLNRKDVLMPRMPESLEAPQLKQEIQEMLITGDFKLAQQELEYVNRIIKDEETMSYKKVLKMLKERQNANNQ